KVLCQRDDGGRIRVRYLCELIRDVLNAQRDFPGAVYEAFFSLGLLGGATNKLSDDLIDDIDPNPPPPDPWGFAKKTSTSPESIERLVEQFRVRLLRSTGAHAFTRESK